MTDIIGYLSIPLVQNMFVAAVLACILCGVVGTYVVVNRMVVVTGGIAHTTFGGVGFAYYVMSVFAVSWFTPMLGALLFGIVAAVVMVACKRIDSLREDTVIGTLWAVGMAIGVVFMHYVNRSVVTPMSYESILFGDMLLINSQKLLVMAAATALILVLVTVFFRDLRMMTFDPVYARISGMKTEALDLLLHIIVAVTCVMVANVVGIIMIMALMTIPAAMGNMFSSDMKGTMVLGAVIATVLSVIGLFLSLLMNTPPGATVVLVIGAVFILVVVFRKVLSGTRDSGPAGSGGR